MYKKRLQWVISARAMRQQAFRKSGIRTFCKETRNIIPLIIVRKVMILRIGWPKQSRLKIKRKKKKTLT